MLMDESSVEKGYRSPLKIDDAPVLSTKEYVSIPHTCHRKNQRAIDIVRNCPNPEEKSKHHVRITLLRCFWKDAAFTVFLAIVRLSAMYVGPTLIQRFVNYIAGKRTLVYEAIT